MKNFFFFSFLFFRSVNQRLFQNASSLIFLMSKISSHCYMHCTCFSVLTFHNSTQKNACILSPDNRIAFVTTFLSLHFLDALLLCKNKIIKKGKEFRKHDRNKNDLNSFIRLTWADILKSFSWQIFLYSSYKLCEFSNHFVFVWVFQTSRPPQSLVHIEEFVCHIYIYIYIHIYIYNLL